MTSGWFTTENDKTTTWLASARHPLKERRRPCTQHMTSSVGSRCRQLLVAETYTGRTCRLRTSASHNYEKMIILGIDTIGYTTLTSNLQFLCINVGSKFRLHGVFANSELVRKLCMYITCSVRPRGNWCAVEYCSIMHTLYHASSILVGVFLASVAQEVRRPRRQHPQGDARHVGASRHSVRSFERVLI